MRLQKKATCQPTIQSYKHDGSLHRTWRDTMVLKATENAIIGVNDHTLIGE